ncbi:hypothetical protein O998_02800 [Anaplasma phagocytophilum str. Norway variant1]|uniref:Uncharacterized protein n=1 Tax=Anaplasma phagocytophilum str. Norway variant1 TaxID=1392506 RepID=A0A7H9DYY8_ANAPH|nr:hypothetical protein [Anaplasma phagocytophilum]QLL66735.1 hypothetical protein O998_02800 [Anaplasma phagocytophilum str. Norway variant1]
MMLLLDKLISLLPLLPRLPVKTSFSLLRRFGVSHPDIDKKVCNGSHAALSGSKNDAVEYSSDLSGASKQTKTAQCSGLKKAVVDASKRKLSKFVGLTRVGDGTHWPTGHGGKDSGGPEIGKTNSNADAMAKDLLEKLSSDEKTIVAGLLAKLLKGARLLKSGRVFFYFYYG